MSFIWKILQLFGLRFAKDNHIMPILRLSRFNRVAGPGYFFIKPFLEETLDAINTGIQVGDFRFHDLLSRDNIPFTMHVTILFRFDPTLPPPAVLQQVVKLTPTKMQNIVRDFASQSLNRLTSNYDAALLSGSGTISRMERHLTALLQDKLSVLGLVPLQKNGVLIKETLLPAKYQQDIITIRRQAMIFQLLAAYRESEVIDQGLAAQLLAALTEGNGQMSLISGLDGAAVPLSLALNGQNGKVDNSTERKLNDPGVAAGTAD